MADKTDKLYIKEDITDWKEETLRDENIIEAEEDILEALERGVSTAKVARAAIVSREMKQAPDDILRPNRSLIMAGAQMDVIQITKRQKEPVKTPGGREYAIPKYVGAVPVREENGNGNGVTETDAEEVREVERAEATKADEPSYVLFDDPRAIERARNYMESHIPGMIWNRLMQIYNGGGDVRDEAKKLKARIDEMTALILEK